MDIMCVKKHYVCSIFFKLDKINIFLAIRRYKRQDLSIFRKLAKTLLKTVGLNN